MSIPHLSLLQKITDLQEKIESLTNQISIAEKNLDHQIAYQNDRLEVEGRRAFDNFTQQKLLAKFKDAITDIRTHEQSIRNHINEKIDTLITEFIQGNGIQELIQMIIDNNSDKNFTILVGEDCAQLVGKFEYQKSENKSELRVKFGPKMYILDPSSLKTSLSDKLFIKSLSV